MPGIYIHIPFCKQACHYCNFHFSTSLKYKSEMLRAICMEVSLQKDYLQGEHIQTVYFGGGTPSLLDGGDLNQIFDALRKYHTISAEAEITLEANPDDLTHGRLEELRAAGVNRLSIGIQSFQQEDLLFMNRSHSVTQALAALDAAFSAGFNNISCDLIYGSPTLSDECWEDNLRTLIKLGVAHLSCYALTVEPKTALSKFIETKKVKAPSEKRMAAQFRIMTSVLVQNGYEHYEISNFCKPGKHALHNTNYWKGVPYLGIGPSAHSFTGLSRQWNIANNATYIKSVLANEQVFEKEILSSADQFNEYLMTSIRTRWGADENRIRREWPQFFAHFEDGIETQIVKGFLEKNGATVILTEKGKFLSDGIISELFYISD